jgi:hypothetical protein
MNLFKLKNTDKLGPPKLVKRRGENWHLSNKVYGLNFYFRGPSDEDIKKIFSCKARILFKSFIICSSIYNFSYFISIPISLLCGLSIKGDYNIMPITDLSFYENEALQMRNRLLKGEHHMQWDYYISLEEHLLISNLDGDNQVPFYILQGPEQKQN